MITPLLMLTWMSCHLHLRQHQHAGPTPQRLSPATSAPQTSPGTSRACRSAPQPQDGRLASALMFVTQTAVMTALSGHELSTALCPGGCRLSRWGRPGGWLSGGGCWCSRLSRRGGPVASSDLLTASSGWPRTARAPTAVAWPRSAGPCLRWPPAGSTAGDSPGSLVPHLVRRLLRGVPRPGSSAGGRHRGFERGHRVLHHNADRVGGGRYPGTQARTGLPKPAPGPADRAPGAFGRLVVVGGRGFPHIGGALLAATAQRGADLAAQLPGHAARPRPDQPALKIANRVAA